MMQASLAVVGGVLGLVACFSILDWRWVLKPEMWPAWLGEEPATVPDLKAMLAPYPSDGMICWPVSPRVGNVKNNDPTLIEPVVVPL
jgi:putative SOS response-associated peptidase YedK